MTKKEIIFNVDLKLENNKSFQSYMYKDGDEFTLTIKTKDINLRNITYKDICRFLEVIDDKSIFHKSIRDNIKEE